MSMKYEEKRAEIRTYLEQASFPGKKIPSEKELAAQFDMNLGMVREVLRELVTADNDATLADLTRAERCGARLVIPEDDEWPALPLHALTLAVSGEPDDPPSVTCGGIVCAGFGGKTGVGSQKACTCVGPPEPA